MKVLTCWLSFRGRAYRTCGEGLTRALLAKQDADAAVESVHPPAGSGGCSNEEARPVCIGCSNIFARGPGDTQNTNGSISTHFWVYITSLPAPRWHLRLILAQSAMSAISVKLWRDSAMMGAAAAHALGFDDIWG
jgi:hypothetical protein